MIIFQLSPSQWGTGLPPSTFYLFMYLISQFMNNIRIVKPPHWKCQILIRIWSKYSFIDGGVKNGTGTLKYILAFSYSAVNSFKPVNPKGNQSWIFIGRTDVEAQAPIVWPPGVRNWLIGKDPDDGKDWRQEEKGVTKDEMVEWHHWLDRHEFKPAPGAVLWRGKPGVLQHMGLQRVGHDWMTELNPCQSKNALGTVRKAREDFIQDYCNRGKGLNSTPLKHKVGDVPLLVNQ